MPSMQTYRIETDYDLPDSGAIVRCGRAAAIWRILTKLRIGTVVELTLEPVDPHDVPLLYPVVEIPLPTSATGAGV